MDFWQKYFNPPTPWGVGQDELARYDYIGTFQSTHSVGSGTVRTITDGIRDADFNPPTPWGVGLFDFCYLIFILNFNPPTPWGVGHFDCVVDNGVLNFNPPTPWGVGPLA